MNTNLNNSHLTVVIPCYNEMGNLAELFTRAVDCSRLEPRIKFVFVDNGSTDSSFEVLQELVAKTPSFKLVKVDINLGYGHGIKAGLHEAEGTYVGWTHADLQTNLMDCIAALAAVDTNHARVFVKGRRSGRPLIDRFFTGAMSVFETCLFRTRISDVNAQPTVFHRDLLEEVLAGPDDFSLDLHALVAAKDSGYLEARVPVLFGKRFSGQSSWNTSFAKRIAFIARTVTYSLALKRNRAR